MCVMLQGGKLEDLANTVLYHRLGEIATLTNEDNSTAERGDHGLSQRFQKGNVIYKSVGSGLMDLSVGLHLIEFAKQKGVGTHVQDF